MRLFFSYALPVNLSMKLMYGNMPSSSSGSQSSAKSFWTSSLGTSSPRLQRMLSSSASIMVPLLFFVIQLQQLKVVSIASLGVWGGNSSFDLLNNIIILGKLLSLLISLAQTNTDLLGDVKTKSIHHISKEEE